MKKCTEYMKLSDNLVQKTGKDLEDKKAELYIKVKELQTGESAKTEIKVNYFKFISHLLERIQTKFKPTKSQPTKSQPTKSHFT